MTLPHLAARIFNTPLLMAEAKAAAILIGVGGRLLPGDVEIVGVAADKVVQHLPRSQLGVVGDPLGSWWAENTDAPMSDVVRGVAIIRVEGTLAHKGSYIGARSGITSYEGLQAQISEARRSPAIRAAVIEVDSFGGEVAGAFETAEALFALSAEKPTLAILTDFALSAGYLLASAARRIVIGPTGMAGSIGVILAHVDISQQLAADGVRVTLISAGKHKADGAPTQPLADPVRERLQERAEAVRTLFAKTVGKFRGDRFPAEVALKTEAMEYQGADAVAAGLVDGMAYAAPAFEAFVTAVGRRR